MRKSVAIVIVALTLALGVGATFAAEKGKSVEGVLVDTACYLKNGAKTNDHGPMKNCGTACAKGGIPVGILTAQGKYITLGVAAPMVADHVGKTVRASGEVKEGVLLPDKFEVQEGSAWKEVKLGPTM
ncbi:MAG: hypothetical protein ACRD4U_12655 [Candidatus Acidiferrales bacterium]